MLTAAARRELAREISNLANASVAEILARAPRAAARPGRRIGFTGPPGVGKSTLIGALVERRAARGSSVAVLAIDPASPYTGGAILGDRIRMDRAAESPRVFMRSVSSRDAQDGMCNNAAEMLEALAARGFDEIVLETVGVGQAEYAVRALVDTVVLLMQPETGDAIQALKAGILEIADIVAVAKSDLAGAARMQQQLVTALRSARGWTPPVVGVSVETGVGLEALEQALAAHAAWVATHREPAELRRARERYRVRDLIARRLEQTLANLDPAAYERPLAELYAAALDGLRVE